MGEGDFFLSWNGSHFGRAGKWILGSGIQGKNGAFSAWFDSSIGKYSFEYSEITGYGITGLVFLNRVEKEPKAIENALRALDWLESEAMTKEGGVLPRNYRQWEERNEKFSFESGNVLSFDTGMVLNGLVALHKGTGNSKAKEMAKKIGNFLENKMFDGRKMSAIYNVKEEKAVEAGDRWSTQPGSYHAKIAIGLIGLGRIAGEKRFENVAVRLCDYALGKQEGNGRFVTNNVNNSTHMHPHCYSCEGLLFAGKELGRQDYIKAAEKGVEWAFENQAGNMGINPYFDGSWNSNQRSDVIAQCLRLGAALKAEGLLETVSNKQLNLLEKRLLEFQDKTGGFLYGKELDGRERNCVNAWCTMFAVQAIAWHAGKGIVLWELV